MLRVEHALSFIDDTTLDFEPMHNLVHVDEKMFYADRNRRSYLVFDGEDPPPRVEEEALYPEDDVLGCTGTPTASLYLFIFSLCE
ncbi:hypothetical protein JG687_00017129 [Phytophthora cactorum]|nr:hypothetical protein JG687_00017129 [Phytophthora cactorum]